MGIILDLIIVLIIGLSAFLAARKGFVRTLIEVVGFVLAIVIAINLSALFADLTYEKAIKPSVTDAVASTVEDTGSDALEKMPDFISSMLESANVDKDGIKANIGESAADAAERISDTAIKPSATGILKAIYTIPIFLILLIAVKILAKLLNSMFKGVILGNANKLLGGVLGGAKGIIYSCIFAFAALFISTLVSGGFFCFTQSAISESFICKFILSFFSINV